MYHLVVLAVTLSRVCNINIFLLALGIDPNGASYGKILTANIMCNMRSIHAGLVKVR